MKRYVFLAVLLLILGELGTIAELWHKYSTERSERKRYQHNTEVLMSDVQFYQTKDSLSAAQVEQLELKNKEVNKWFAEEVEAVKTLQTKNRELERLVKTGAKTEAKIITEIRDSIIHDTVTVKAKCFDYQDPWLAIHGWLVNNKMEADVAVYDTLIIAETVKYKRFLGFLWKTNKIKDDHWDIKSTNPHTKISDFKVIKVIY